MRRVLSIPFAVTLIVLTGCVPGQDATATVVPSERNEATVFLEQVRTTWSGAVPDGEVLLDLGVSACAQLEAGVAHSSVAVFPSDEASGDTATANTRTIVDAAALSLCPAASQ